MSSLKDRFRAKSLVAKPNRNSSVKKVIAIASGKGGVGKSLVTSLLAILLRQKGYKTAIIDGDITGPSIPKIFGVEGELLGNELGILPNVSKSGIKMVSSTFLLKEDTDPVLWRGPIVNGLLKQFWTDVVWEDVDYMFIDMPPGTGDVPLTVYQSMPVDAIIVVASPQELVSMIVAKAVKMANKMNKPVLGIVENMSYVKCDECGHQIKVFGESHVDQIAEDFGLRVLAKMPLDPKIAALCDKGELESISIDYLDETVRMLEELPVDVNIVAVPVEGDNVHEHMGHTKKFNIYQIIKDMVASTKTVDVEGDGLEAVINTLRNNNVKSVLVTKIGDTFLDMVNDADITVYPCEKGDAKEALYKFIDDQPVEIISGNCECSTDKE
jgi:Mrp family chromosome partitioning ATPase/predicted Fe-Mo cluster-binding NifX family protein